MSQFRSRSHPMANQLAHALFALALSSLLGSFARGDPLNEYGFYAALASLLPDLEVGRDGSRRTPHGHSLAYGLLWAFCVLSGISLAGWSGLLPLDPVPLLVGACLIGLVSHLLLDALTEPGIFTWPKAGGRWGHIAGLHGRWPSAFNLLVSGLSVGTILALLVLY